MKMIVSVGTFSFGQEQIKCTKAIFIYSPKNQVLTKDWNANSTFIIKWGQQNSNLLAPTQPFLFFPYIVFPQIILVSCVRERGTDLLDMLIHFVIR